MPYRHPNHKNRYNQQQDQAKYKQVSMKVDLGWITPEKMQHITSEFEDYIILSRQVSQLQKQKIMRRQFELEQEIGLSLIML
jgi:hypothetical protein